MLVIPVYSVTVIVAQSPMSATKPEPTVIDQVAAAVLPVVSTYCNVGIVKCTLALLKKKLPVATVVPFFLRYQFFVAEDDVYDVISAFTNNWPPVPVYDADHSVTAVFVYIIEGAILFNIIV